MSAAPGIRSANRLASVTSSQGIFFAPDDLDRNADRPEQRLELPRVLLLEIRNLGEIGRLARLARPWPEVRGERIVA